MFNSTPNSTRNHQIQNAALRTHWILRTPAPNPGFAGVSLTPRFPLHQKTNDSHLAPGEYTGGPPSHEKPSPKTIGIENQNPTPSKVTAPQKPTLPFVPIRQKLRQTDVRQWMLEQVHKKPIRQRRHARAAVTANSVCPGPTQTPFLARVAADAPDAQKVLDAMTRAVPMRRIGSPDDVAPLVAFLASEQAGYITGQTISASGGLTMA